MNFAIIMTDTQPTFFLGAYGNPNADTPNIDRLAFEGVRFDRAYTACPLCTPARGALFSGLPPEVNGAWTNNNAPHCQHALMGEIFSHYGYRAGYTGKWHLDGSAYSGDGTPGGGFEPDWWYDGKVHLKTIADGRAAGEIDKTTPEQETLWAHGVADRAVDFLESAGTDPFVLVASFDEPHGPFGAPLDYYDRYTPSMFPRRPNYDAPADGKPELLRIQRAENSDVPYEEYAAAERTRKMIGCNNYLDREIGRVIDAVDSTHPDDTVIMFTTDHGDQMRSHGLIEKGPMMYEETCNIPLIVKCPGGRMGAASNALVSHLDIIPTMLDFAGIKQPEMLRGSSFRAIMASAGSPVSEDELHSIRSIATVSFHRFAINNDGWGEFYPIRCITDGHHKLILNLFETDELYDLKSDPYEMTNVLEAPGYSAVRDTLHDALLDEMDANRDPFRSFRWGARPWRTVRGEYYLRGTRGNARNKPAGFPFQPTSF